MAGKLAKVNKKAKEDIIIGIFLILLSAVIYAATYQLPEARIATSGPSFWPRVLVILMVIMSTVMIANAIIMLKVKQIKVEEGEIQETEEPEKDLPAKEKMVLWWARFRKPIIAIASTFLFYFLFRPLGFILSVTVLAAVLALLVEHELKRKKVIKILIQSVVLAMGMYYLFGEFLSVRLPRGIL